MAFENISLVPMPPTSHLESAGFDPVARVILIRFKSGKGGAYHGATEEEFNAMIADPNPGKYIHRVLKGKYGWEAL